jgi:streptogrisin C
MEERIGMKTQRLIRGAITGIALVAVGFTTSTPVATADVMDRSVQEVQDEEASAELMRAMQRDLGLTPEQAANWIVAQDAALRLHAELVPRLGEESVGSWFDGHSGRLVVAVTSTESAEQARAAGAEARVVRYSAAHLESIKAGLDELARTDPQALDGIASWGVDPQTDTMTVTVLSGQPPARALEELARYGDAVRIAETDVEAAPTALLRGGDKYTTSVNCSVGFNAFSGNLRYFLTAGHCGSVNTQAWSGGVWVGPVTKSTWTNTDYGAVRVDNTLSWTQGPWINAYVPNNPNLVYNVNGYRFSLVGTAICKSGFTTKLTCGVIKAKGQAVPTDHDKNPATPKVTVFGLVHHNACAEPGDSGGSNFSWDAANRNYAEGMTSLAATINFNGIPRCLSFFGQQNSSYYSLVTEALVKFNLSLWTAP